MKRLLPTTLLVVACVLLMPACADRATPAQCEQILDRLVQLRLEERGFQDPALVTARRAAFREVLAAELHSCSGLRLETGAMECVQNAKTGDALLNTCFVR